MKNKILILLALTIVLLVTVVGCKGADNSLEGKNIVTFELAGGTLKYSTSSTKTKINFAYYPGTYIIAPQDIYGYELSRSGYDFTGWYTSPDCLPSELWDFDTPFNTETLTLYAGWKESISYTYTLYYTDESGEIYLGTFDSRATKDNPTSIRVLKGATVTFYLTKHQLFSETAASSVTVTSLDDIHSTDYTKDWSATSTSPVIYTVKAISIGGTGVGKLNSVSIVYDLTNGSVKVTLKSSSSGLSSGSSFKVNGTSASSSGFIFKSYTYSATFTADTTLDVV